MGGVREAAAPHALGAGATSDLVSAADRAVVSAASTAIVADASRGDDSDALGYDDEDDGGPLRTEARDPDPESQTVTVKLSVEPQHCAHVFWGVKDLGVAPLDIARPRGSGPLDLILRCPGYLAFHTRAFTDRDDKLAIALVPESAAARVFGYRSGAGKHTAAAKTQAAPRGVPGVTPLPPARPQLKRAVGDTAKTAAIRDTIPANATGAADMDTTNGAADHGAIAPDVAPGSTDDVYANPAQAQPRHRGRDAAVD